MVIVVGDVAKDRRRTNQPRFRPAGRPTPPADQRGALVDAGLNQALHLVELQLRDQRPHRGGAVARVAHHHRLGGLLRNRQRLDRAGCGGTNIRVGASQDWPVLPKQPSTPAAFTAAGRSAVGRMMLGDLPPSSCATRFTVGAAAAAIAVPARVEPVKDTMSTCGCEDIRAPTSGPCRSPG
jgi:hypothetical protein